MRPSTTHEALVTSQFGPQAAAYVASAVHAQGADLTQMAEALALRRPATVLDLGCGGGHVSFAAALPFADASFEAVATRFSTHHWGDAAKGLAEAGRVLKPGGIALFADVFAPADPLLDTFLQSFELLRDPSHVRNYSIAQWRGMVEAAGLTVASVTQGRLPLDFAAWIKRINTPPHFAAAIRALQQAMAERVRAHFAIDEDGNFSLDAMVMVAHKA